MSDFHKRPYDNGAGGGSMTGKGYGFVERMEYHRGVAAREAEAATARAPSAPASSIPVAGALPTSGPTTRGMGRASPTTGGRTGNRREVGYIISTLLLLAAFFGAYDNYKNRSSPEQSYSTAFDKISGISDAFGKRIRNMNPQSEFLEVVDVVQSVAGFTVAVAVGAGAFVGNLAVDMVKAFKEGYNAGLNETPDDKPHYAIRR